MNTGSDVVIRTPCKSDEELVAEDLRHLRTELNLTDAQWYRLGKSTRIVRTGLPLTIKLPKFRSGR